MLGASDSQSPQTAPGDSSRMPTFQQNPTRSARPNQDQVSNAQPSTVPEQHPAVKRAGLMHSIAEALAGGPRYSETIDADGNRQFKRVPVSGRQLAMAIAMEAIQGSLTGLAAGRGRGPGAAGAAAMTQAMQQRQQQQQRQDDLAQKQFDDKSSALTQQASAYAASLRTRALAQEVGMRDEQSHKDWIASHASTVQYLRDMAPGAVIKDNVPESEITDPAFTRDALQNGWTAIPVGVTPRYDSQGNHFTKDGIPLHDDLYMVVDNRKITVPPDIVQKAKEWRLPGFIGWTDRPTNLNDFQLRIGTILDTSNKVASLELEQKDLNDYYGFLNSKGMKVADGQPLVAPDLKQAVNQNPSLIYYLTGPWANHFGETPSAALKAMKDSLPAKGPIANLYGGKQLLDKYDLLKSLDAKGSEKQLEANIEIGKERALVPIKAATAGAEEAARVAANPQNNDVALTTPDALGFAPHVPGGLREYNKRQGTFKKNADDLSKSEATFQQFQSIVKDINAGRFTGAESVVGLFDAIGISATPLAGRGFRVNNNVIEEHAHARGWAGVLQQKLLSVKAGDVITPQQLKDYANIAAQARESQYINLVNQVHNQGLNADFVLPTGNGQTLDQSTARIFLQLSGNDAAKAAAAAKTRGWVIQ